MTGVQADELAAVVVHASGFVDGSRPSEVKVALYRGRLVDVANGVLTKVRQHGHEVQASTTRTLDGWLREVRAFVDIDGTEMWHVFSTPSEPWTMASAAEIANGGDDS